MDILKSARDTMSFTIGFSLVYDAVVKFKTAYVSSRRYGGSIRWNRFNKVFRRYINTQQMVRNIGTRYLILMGPIVIIESIKKIDDSISQTKRSTERESDKSR